MTVSAIHTEASLPGSSKISPTRPCILRQKTALLISPQTGQTNNQAPHRIPIVINCMPPSSVVGYLMAQNHTLLHTNYPQPNSHPIDNLSGLTAKPYHHRPQVLCLTASPLHPHNTFPVIAKVKITLLFKRKNDETTQSTLPTQVTHSLRIMPSTRQGKKTRTNQRRQGPAPLTQVSVKLQMAIER